MSSSPFPGMDPYLEGHLWPDVHQRLATAICELLAPQISPAYLALMNVYTVSDTAPEEDIGIMYPDVEVLRKKAEEPTADYTTAGPPPPTPATLRIPDLRAVEVRIPVVEIRDRKENRLITAIELLSPVNKRNPGLAPYREKRMQLLRAGVHLLEIDLIRRGQRPIIHPRLPTSHYLVTLVRAGSGHTDVWAVQLQDELPVLPIPLLPPDKDAVLDLGKALHLIYDRAFYQLAIDYRETLPPPAFNEEESTWILERLRAGSKKG